MDRDIQASELKPVTDLVAPMMHLDVVGLLAYCGPSFGISRIPSGASTNFLSCFFGPLWVFFSTIAICARCHYP